jgi:hypothetical protein
MRRASPRYSRTQSVHARPESPLRHSPVRLALGPGAPRTGAGKCAHIPPGSDRPARRRTDPAPSAGVRPVDQSVPLASLRSPAGSGGPHSHWSAPFTLAEAPESASRRKPTHANQLSPGLPAGIDVSRGRRIGIVTGLGKPRRTSIGSRPNRTGSNSGSDPEASRRLSLVTGELVGEDDERLALLDDVRRELGSVAMDGMHGLCGDCQCLPRSVGSRLAAVDLVLE